MMMAIVGRKWEYITHIYRIVGDRRFRCSDVDEGYPELRAHLRGMVDRGILIRYPYMFDKSTSEYQISAKAIEKIRKFDHDI
jgi:hypothetical protein